jgi:hypothetical protein
MQRLNLPTYSFKIKSEGENDFIFDRIRKKYIKLTPEEWVRQNFLSFLEAERGYPSARIILEKSIRLYELGKRVDILVCDSYGMPLLLVECKAPDVTISDKVFHQLSSYNIHFKARYLVVTNGMENYCCKLDFKSEKITFLSDIPYYRDIDCSPD